VTPSAAATRTAARLAFDVTYNGKVREGGPPDMREPADLITKVSARPMDNNAYLLR
jgi:hypothetical protein